MGVFQSGPQTRHFLWSLEWFDHPRDVYANFIKLLSGGEWGIYVAGAKGGVSFLRVIHAIEGMASLFHCDLEHVSSGCLIQGTMANAEQALERHLQEKKLVDLTINLDQKWLAAFTNALR